MKIIPMFLMVLYLIIYNVYVDEIIKITDSFMTFIGLGVRDFGASGLISFTLTMIWPLVLFLVFVLALACIPVLIRKLHEKQMGN